jgi:hypothetical protein
MDPGPERDAVMRLVEWAQDWMDAPVLESSQVVHVTDQFAAALVEGMDNAAMTEGERVCFGLGFMECARWVHQQLVEWGIHDEEAPAFLCESAGLISGVVASKATGGSWRP